MRGFYDIDIFIIKCIDKGRAEPQASDMLRNII